MKKIISVILVVFLFAGVLAGCSKKKNDENSNAENKPESAQLTEEEIKKELEKETKEAEEKLVADDNAVAIVGDFTISQAYYNFMYKSIYEQMAVYSEQYGENWLDATLDGQTTIREYIKNSTMEQIKLVVAANIVAKDYGITPDNEEIKNAIKEEKAILIETCGGQNGYNEFLQQCRSDDVSVDKNIEQYEIYDRLIAKLTEESEGNSKTDALKEFNNKYFKVQYIFITAGEMPQEDGKSLLRSDDEAKFVAETVIERLNSGENFHDMMDTYNEDAAMVKESHHMFSEESVAQELFDATKNLGFGEYTKVPVKSGGGFYIIKHYTVDENDETFAQVYVEDTYTSAYDVVINKADSMAVAVKYDVINLYTDSWLKELQGK